MQSLNANAAFFLFAAAAQLAFGTTILVRRPRSEPAWVLAVMFFANAGDCVGAAILNMAGGDSDIIGWVRRSRFYFDKTVTYLVAYLALCYPSRPRLLRRKWTLPALVLGPLAFFLVLAAVDGAGFYGSNIGSYNYDGVDRPWGFLDQVVLTSLPFSILLVRWSYVLVRERSPVLLRQFRLVFAAFGVRAVHIGLQIALYDFTLHRPITSVLPGAAGQVWAVVRIVQLLVIVATLAYLVLARRGVTTDVRRSVDFVLFFLLLGALEVFPAEVALGRSILSNPLQFLDVVLLRPVLLYFAIVRYDIIGIRFRSQRLGTLILAVVAVPLFFVGLLPLFGPLLGDGLARNLAAGAVALGLTAAVHALLIPYLRHQAAGPGDLVPKVEEYVAAVEDLHRNGQASPERIARLEPLRRSLRISDEQAAALRDAVASRWASGKGDWLPGTRVRGRYEVVRLMGEGANAATYLARDLLTEQQVVLKRLRRLDEAGKRAILHEAYQLSRLEHPNVVRCLRTEDLDGEPVLVLEHLGGGSLATRLAQRGRLAPEEAAAVGRDVLRGLVAAHALGVVHRDVKPSNILFDGAGNAKLCDFGIARQPLGPRPGLGDPTPSGEHAAGTLRYMSPEQVRGLAADARSDLYAVGVVLYEAAAGEHPVPPELPDYEMRRLIVEGPVPAIPRGLPEWMRRALRHLLDKDPRRRPRTASMAVAELAPATPRGTAAGSARPG